MTLVVHQNPYILEVGEYDKGGNLKATYVESGKGASAPRVDRILPVESRKPWRRLLNVFLSDGYPHSVTDDYTQYQVYDSFQAFAGSIAGMISSRAVWEGLGVGNASASPTEAMLIQIIRECVGKLGTIAFAYSMGTAIEAETKMYRLKSDFFCDMAMILDCLSPLFPISLRVLVLCISSILYAAAGVAGGACKSSLSGHFARWSNLGELNAKDSSQETAISLIGNLAGTITITFLTTKTATWLVLVSLLVAHLAMNRTGVRAVEMRTLNRQRANIAFSSLLDEDRVTSPKEASERELIFERSGGSVLRGKTGRVIGNCEFGASVQTVIDCLAPERRYAGAGPAKPSYVNISQVMETFQQQAYILWFKTSQSNWLGRRQQSPRTKIWVVLKDGITPQRQLAAWYHALLLARRIEERSTAFKATGLQRSEETPEAMLSQVEITLDHVHKTFDKYAIRLKAAGWAIDIPALETSAGSRIVCEKR